jgi:hypothetical protein
LFDQLATIISVLSFHLLGGACGRALFRAAGNLKRAGFGFTMNRLAIINDAENWN